MHYTSDKVQFLPFSAIFVLLGVIFYLFWYSKPKYVEKYGWKPLPRAGINFMHNLSKISGVPMPHKFNMVQFLTFSAIFALFGTFFSFFDPQSSNILKNMCWKPLNTPGYKLIHNFKEDFRGTSAQKSKKVYLLRILTNFCRFSLIFTRFSWCITWIWDGFFFWCPIWCQGIIIQVKKW